MRRVLLALALVLTACGGGNPGRQAGWRRDASWFEAWWGRLEYGAYVRSQPAPAALPVPVEGVTKGMIADTFGAPRSGGRTHEGADIFAPAGTPVRAAAEGMVVRVGENSLGGRTVTVWGAGDRTYYYAHLSRYADIQEGEIVRAGDLIGYVGNTGNARGTPPHLHFGVYESGWRAVNPYTLLGPDPAKPRAEN